MLKVIVQRLDKNTNSVENILVLQINKGVENILLEAVKSTLDNTGEVLTQVLNNLEIENDCNLVTKFDNDYKITWFRI